MKYEPESWTRKVWAALFAVVGIAFGARIAWEILRPAVPLLIVLLGLLGLYSVVLGRWRR